MSNKTEANKNLLEQYDASIKLRKLRKNNINHGRNKINVESLNNHASSPANEAETELQANE